MLFYLKHWAHLKLVCRYFFEQPNDFSSFKSYLKFCSYYLQFFTNDGTGILSQNLKQFRGDEAINSFVSHEKNRNIKEGPGKTIRKKPKEKERENNNKRAVE